MTKAEYQQYQIAVAAFYKREGIQNLSHQLDSNGEPTANYFSYSPCHVCKRHLDGDRIDMCGYNPTTNDIQLDYSVCLDCQYYVEYGQLDDMTMLDMEG